MSFGTGKTASTNLAFDIKAALAAIQGEHDRLCAEVEWYKDAATGFRGGYGEEEIATVHQAARSAESASEHERIVKERDELRDKLALVEGGSALNANALRLARAENERLRGLVLEACRSLELCDRRAAGREFREAIFRGTPEHKDLETRVADACKLSNKVQPKRKEGKK